MQAALTGHLVLSTLHTNDAVGAITRLVDMGLEEYLVSAVLKGVVAQRLVRCLCRSCRGRGCAECGGSGYRGLHRDRGAAAVHRPARAARRVDRADPARLRDAARDAGMVDLRRDGMAKAAAGITSEEEVMRVLGAG